ncbi:unnamed protein product [Hyaloperonospora brassicae]|uniref:Endonuclease III homolog n=1 Tax=Hyaloperonospora brassicae TaxID=162125 RepID=A0AAV0UCK4_HYABA|nr:unnamed protein product [Hyaloperonospora brassicae]
MRRLRSSSSTVSVTTTELSVDTNEATAVKTEAQRVVPPVRRPRSRHCESDTDSKTVVKREHVARVKLDSAVKEDVELTRPRRKQKKQKVEKPEQRVMRSEPVGWREMWKGIEDMRANEDAEVDKYGCEVFSSKGLLPHVCRFHVLIAAMMSSQTKDPVNAAAMDRLIEHGLTVQSMLEVKEQKLAQLIRPVGFFNMKAKYIKQVASILTKRAEAEGKDVVDIPDSYEGLMALPGVGPKMATLVMTCAWNNTVGICVDTHVHRISNRLNWVKTWNVRNPKSQDPEKTRAELEDWLPRDHWGPINRLLVGFGQTICLPRNPKCADCKIRDKCPSACVKR